MKLIDCAEVGSLLMLASPPALERIHDFIWLLAGTPTTAVEIAQIFAERE
jgi:hypothetical protein